MVLIRIGPKWGIPAGHCPFEKRVFPYAAIGAEWTRRCIPVLQSGLSPIAPAFDVPVSAGPALLHKPGSGISDGP